jgi:hypothetical protein
MKPLLLAVPLLAACATIPETSSGDQNLPNAAAGPFRELVDGEIGNSRSAPDGLDDSRDFGRDIAVLDADGDPSTLEVLAYVAASIAQNGMDPTPTSPTRTLVRYGALDGRSFDRADEVVLQADAVWEGGVLASPAAVRSGGTIFLYYAAAGGIGLATSADSHVFAKVPGPVLGPVAGGWEQGAVPAAPGVAVLADGTFRMFYQVATGPGATSIGEASSPDGMVWTRLGSAPALAPAGLGDGGDEPWDSTSVGSPFPVLAVSADGRAILRLYYGARDSTGLGTVGLAARYGTDGPLERAVSAVFGTTKPLDAREPCVVPFTDFTFVYATEEASTTDTHPVIAVGVAPATAMLPPPVAR